MVKRTLISCLGPFLGIIACLITSVFFNYDLSNELVCLWFCILCNFLSYSIFPKIKNPVKGTITFSKNKNDNVILSLDFKDDPITIVNYNEITLKVDSKILKEDIKN